MAFSEEPGLMWDLFICHASEDKQDFVNALAKRLTSLSLRVWYDDDILLLGDSLNRSINEGLAKSRYGIVVLSPSFFKKEWPQKELDGLVVKERNGIKVILPIWHRVDFNDVVKYSPILADKIAAKSSEGIDIVVNKILKAIQEKDKSEELDRSTYYRDVSDEEVEVLLSALASAGIIKIIETEQMGTFLQIGDRDYYDDYNPEVRVSYLEALRKLIDKGLVFEENERWLNLTKPGYEYAHNLETNSLMEKAWECYENKKDYLRSIEIYAKIVERYPTTGLAKEAQKMIGVNYLHLYDPIKAEKELKKAIDMGNDFSSAYFYYGEALLNNKKHKEAKMAFEGSLSKSDAPEWIKSAAPGKIKLCQNGVIATLAALADEKYEIEKDRINKEIPLQEADLKHKAGLRGQRWSSGLARELLELNLGAAKKKLETRLKLDKEILFSGKKIETKEDVVFLFDRLKVTADSECQILKQRIEDLYKNCRANSLIDVDKTKIDQEIETILKEKHTDLMIEKESA